MSRWPFMWCALTLGIGGCGETAQFNSKCDKITTARCQREETCEGFVDYLACETDHEAVWTCNPDAPLEDLDACAEQLNPVGGLPCDSVERFPQICVEVLCSTLLGCELPPTTPTPPYE